MGIEIDARNITKLSYALSFKRSWCSSVSDESHLRHLYALGDHSAFKHLVGNGGRNFVDKGCAHLWIVL